MITGVGGVQHMERAGRVTAPVDSPQQRQLAGSGLALQREPLARGAGRIHLTAPTQPQRTGADQTGPEPARLRARPGMGCWPAVRLEQLHSHDAANEPPPAFPAQGAAIHPRAGPGRQQKLADVTSVADVVQRALLPPLPGRIGPLELQVVYLAAAARVGGDLYEVARTPFGIRLIVGDARGKGLEEVETAADVLGVFREVAHEVYTLAEAARRIDASLARRLAAGQAHGSRPGEEFVTAVLTEIDPAAGQLTIYNCGHPPPLLLSPGTGDSRKSHAGRNGQAAPSVTSVEVPSPAPPLRLLPLGDCSAAGRCLSRPAGRCSFTPTASPKPATRATGTIPCPPGSGSWPGPAPTACAPICLTACGTICSAIPAAAWTTMPRSSWSGPPSPGATRRHSRHRQQRPRSGRRPVCPG